MKYQKGDKFVIEITGKENGAYVSERFTQGDEIRAVFPECILDSFEKLDSAYINEHYGVLQDRAYVEGKNAGIEEGKLVGYEQGMNDAWELARKICSTVKDGGMSVEEIREVFSLDATMLSVLMDYTPQEAKAKIEAWEKSKAEIKVGDVVMYKGGNKEFVVTSTKDDSGEKWCSLLSSDGSLDILLKENLVKTGRSIDIQSVLEQIGGTT